MRMEFVYCPLNQLNGHLEIIIVNTMRLLTDDSMVLPPLVDGTMNLGESKLNLSTCTVTS